MNRIYRPLLVLCMAVGVSSCLDAPSPSAPTTQDQPHVARSAAGGAPTSPLSTDEEFVRIAREEIPGFAGYYWDQNGDLNLLLTGRGSPGHAALRITQVLSTRLFVRSERRPTSSAVQIRSARYDFVQLYEWRNRVRSILDTPGLLFLDIDEVRNRIWIGVEDSAARERIRVALARLQIPAEAVAIEETDPILTRTAYLEDNSGDSGGGGSTQPTLRDKVRPLVGGLITIYDKDPNDGILDNCTLGLNVHLNGLAGYVTNSHCTIRKGGNEGTKHFQISYGAEQIGTEQYDPEWMGCQYGTRCRYSDAAFMYLTDSWYKLATIARTKTANYTELVIDPYSEFKVVDEWRIPMRVPEVGMTMHKVGQRTGWSYGEITDTCHDSKVDDGTWLLCQYFVAATAKEGDSGAAVFILPFWDGSTRPDAPGTSTDAWIWGLLWGVTHDGTKYAFSWWQYVQQELGDMSLQ